ncbi:hypothetical protein ELH80_14135 [Rhizobium ruizarguesonis]|nr:hypothetical protein ELH80_14135 [Rhizobium ruizarguesonis]
MTAQTYLDRLVRDLHPPSRQGCDPRRGADQVVLSTAYQNEAARRLFAAAGFAPTMIETTMLIGNVRKT